MSKHIAKQVPITWDQPEPFALVVEQTLDGERVTNEKARRERDRAEAEKNQPALV